MPNIYFVGGASGSGKTAILETLQKVLGSHIAVYDFDDIGVPDNADKKWRQESTEKWLLKLLSEDRDACLLGQVVLGDILACPSAKKLSNISYCLLNVSDEERIRRLKIRANYSVNQGTLNWAAWLRMHLHSPQWEQHVLKDDCWEGLNFSNWESLDTWPQHIHLHQIDTTHFSIEQVAHQVKLFIERDIPLPKAIFLNGASSSGKTTLAKKLQENFGEPFLHIGIDKLIGMMPAKLNDWKGGYAEQGFWWDISQDNEGRSVALIQQGPYAKRISDLLLKMVLTVLKEGHNVIIDEVCLDKEVYENWRKALAPYETLFVGLKASVKTLQARELARGNRMIGSALAQANTLHENKTYDLILETDVISLDQCAQQIVSLIKK